MMLLTAYECVDICFLVFCLLGGGGGGERRGRRGVEGIADWERERRVAYFSISSGHCIYLHIYLLTVFHFIFLGRPVRDQRCPRRRVSTHMAKDITPRHYTMTGPGKSGWGSFYFAGTAPGESYVSTNANTLVRGGPGPQSVDNFLVGCGHIKFQGDSEHQGYARRPAYGEGPHNSATATAAQDSSKSPRTEWMVRAIPNGPRGGGGSLILLEEAQQPRAMGDARRKRPPYRTHI